MVVDLVADSAAGWVVDLAAGLAADLVAGWVVDSGADLEEQGLLQQ